MIVNMLIFTQKGGDSHEHVTREKRAKETNQ